MDIKKNLLLLARAIPSTALVEDFEAKRALDAMAEILRKLVVNEINRQAEVRVEPKYLSIVEGDGILIDKLPNNVRRINAEEIASATGGGGSNIYVGDDSVAVSGLSITLENDEKTPGNDKVYGTDASGDKGWKADPGGIDFDGTNDGDIIAWDQTTDKEWEKHLMASLVDNDMMQWDSATKKWEKCHGPHDPSSTDTIGSAAEGNEAAETTTNTFTGTKGLKLYIQGRTTYYHAGDKKLYGYTRELRFDRMGRLYYVSGETRWDIDVPVAES